MAADLQYCSPALQLGIFDVLPDARDGRASAMEAMDAHDGFVVSPDVVAKEMASASKSVIKKSRKEKEADGLAEMPLER